MNVEVTAVGLSELRRQLAGIDRAFPREILTPSMREAVEPVVPAVKAAAPVGETGALRGSVRALGSQNRVAVAAGNRRAFYARFVHDGTVHIDPNPFLDRYAEIHTPAVLRRVEQGVVRRIRARGLDVS